MTITVNGTAETWNKLSDDGKASTYYRPGHTERAPKLVKFQRMPAAIGASNPNSRDKYIVTFIRGELDPESGEPRQNPTVVSVEIRKPRANTDSLADDLIDALQGLAAEGTILDNLSLGISPQGNAL